MFKKVISGSVALLFLLVAVTSTVSGASVVGGNGLKVSPVRTDLVIKPGQSRTVNLILENITKVKTTYEVTINNFTANGTSGTPKLIASSSPYSIQKFIKPIPNITIGANQSQSVPVQIAVPANASGGGYFGAIRFVAISSGSGKNLNIAASVASLVLIQVPGPNFNEQLGLSGFTVKDNGNVGGFFFSNKGLSAVALFQNTGNVQAVPFGKISVQNTTGKTVMSSSINNVNPPGNVLPASSRTFSVPLSHIGSFGKYTVYGNFGYGSNGELLSGKVSFYVVAPWIIVLIVVILALIVALIWLTPKFFRSWYQRSIRKIKQV